LNGHLPSNTTLAVICLRYEGYPVPSRSTVFSVGEGLHFWPGAILRPHVIWVISLCCGRMCHHGGATRGRRLARYGSAVFQTAD
jgi:hypothetical protein